MINNNKQMENLVVCGCQVDRGGEVGGRNTEGREMREKQGRG